MIRPLAATAGHGSDGQTKRVGSTTSTPAGAAARSAAAITLSLLADPLRGNEQRSGAPGDSDRQPGMSTGATGVSRKRIAWSVILWSRVNVRVAAASQSSGSGCVTFV